ncbi:MAG: ATP-binding cassette domain-containing protein [Alphaproteobacteria bacterium]|jgi:phospholipid/cholesterol/gamma-HCH transport system ATP-binding protein|nr:ATP-binding cassette domain-containing protein [Alphaproteobacteria bacterium]
MKKDLMNGLYANMSENKEENEKEKNELKSSVNLESPSLEEDEVSKTKEKIKNMVENMDNKKDKKTSNEKETFYKADEVKNELDKIKNEVEIIDSDEEFERKVKEKIQASLKKASIPSPETNETKEIKKTAKKKAKTEKVEEVKAEEIIENDEIKMASEDIFNIEVPAKNRKESGKKTKKEKKISADKEAFDGNLLKLLSFSKIKKAVSGKIKKPSFKLPKIKNPLSPIGEKISGKVSSLKAKFDKKDKVKKITSKKKVKVSVKKENRKSLKEMVSFKTPKIFKKKDEVKAKPAADNSIINFENVSKTFDGEPVLNDFSVKVKKGESFVILGRSGGGKSVFIKIANGLLKPDSGEVSVFGKKITGFFGTGLYKLNKDISFLFQGNALFDSMTVLENVAFGIIESQRIKKEIAFDIAREKLADVDLDADEIGEKYPSELSGGMQKRVALARAIATNPKIIFFDEPTTGLDPITSEIIDDLIIRSVKKIGATAVTITHDIHSAIKIADRIALLNNGKLEWKGSPADIKKAKNENIKLFLKNL